MGMDMMLVGVRCNYDLTVITEGLSRKRFRNAVCLFRQESLIAQGEMSCDKAKTLTTWKSWKVILKNILLG